VFFFLSKFLGRVLGFVFGAVGIGFIADISIIGS
jgi:hypothetical protein